MFEEGSFNHSKPSHRIRSASLGRLWPDRPGQGFLITFACLFLASCFGSKAPKSPLASLARMPTTGYGWNGQHSVWQTEASLDAAGTAAVAGLRRLGFALDHLGSRRGSNSAYLLAKAQGDKETRTAEVKINPGGRGKTEIQVKVGIVGDRTASERILDEIRASLGGETDPSRPGSPASTPTDPKTDAQDSSRSKGEKGEKGEEKGRNSGGGAR